MGPIPARLTLKPLRFLGSIGAACLLLGAILLAVVCYQEFTGDRAGLYGRPLPLIAVMLIVLGVQIIGLCLVSEIIARIVAWMKSTGSK